MVPGDISDGERRPPAGAPWALLRESNVVAFLWCFELELVLRQLIVCWAAQDPAAARA